MNKDYTYCFGFNIFYLAKLCKSCRRFIPGNQAPKEAIWWTSACYDPNTGKCPIYEPKTNNNQ